MNTLTESRLYFYRQLKNWNFWMINDRPQKKTKQRILEQYMLDTQDVLVGKISALTNFNTPLTEEDEKRLRAMLNLLIDARRTWQEEPK